MQPAKRWANGPFRDLLLDGMLNPALSTVRSSALSARDDSTRTTVPLMPGAEPYSAEGDHLGVLVLHGFGGTPAVVRPWAQHLAAAGHTVSAPRLPGHGTRWQDLNATTWEDWVEEAERCLDLLREHTDTRVVMGLGAGATISLRLAEIHPDVHGVVAVNPMVHSERRERALLPYVQFIGSIPWRSDDVKRPGLTDLGYDRLPLRAVRSLTRLWALVRSDIHRITAPVLVFRSADDHMVEPSNTTWLLANLRSSRVEEVLLEDSFHLATVDNDAPAIFEASTRFARSLGEAA